MKTLLEAQLAMLLAQHGLSAIAESLAQVVRENELRHCAHYAVHCTNAVAIRDLENIASYSRREGV